MTRKEKKDRPSIYIDGDPDIKYKRIKRVFPISLSRWLAHLIAIHANCLSPSAVGQFC
jgi:hypothetical protein